jgi:hypothetical protein
MILCWSPASMSLVQRNNPEFLFNNIPITNIYDYKSRRQRKQR